MLKMNVDPKAVLGVLDDVQLKQLPFAVSVALNRTANQAQGAMQRHLMDRFNLKRSRFVLQGIKIQKADRATKTSWSVIIQVAPETDFLVRSEDGDPHTPTHGKWLWKPNQDVFGGRVIMRSDPLHPANLQFDQNKRGPLGTFMVQPKNPKAGPLVLQRVARAGKGVSQPIALGQRHQVGRNEAGQFTRGKAVKAVRRGGVRMLYQLVPRSNVPAKLEFVSTIAQAVEVAFPWEMQQAMDEALRPKR